MLDIWCQDNNITSYIEGSEIYKVELKIENNEINSYCSCPYSEGGEYTCKHIAAVLYYLKENDIPELECIPREETNVVWEDKLSKIYSDIKYKLKKISDRNGYVNYYNGKYFIYLIENISEYINYFIDNEEYNNAFELIKYTYNFINDIDMDGSNGEYQDFFNIICKCASNLLKESKEYFNTYYDYASEVYFNNELGDFSAAPMYAFIHYVHDKESAEKVIILLDEIKISYGMFVDSTVDKITLTYNYISKDEAIKLCYKHIENYGAKKLLIDYLKKDNKIDELIKVLKDDLKNHIGKDNAYRKLFDIYDEYNMKEEKKKILPEVIIETLDFNRYKELKNMCNNSEWKELRDNIISKIKRNDRDILEKIYMEENEVDKLFELIKKDSNIYKLSSYQDGVKDKYSEELLKMYKKEIIEMTKRVNDRDSYQNLCFYIGKMRELNNSDDFIFNMIREMYPYYKNKRAFKEEIMHVLSNNNKVKFNNLIKK